MATLASPQGWLEKIKTMKLDMPIIAGLTGLILMIILYPLPLWVMDVLLIINLSFSILLLMTTISVDSPMRLSSFPSLLLIITLFRLSLNVATTRLILSEGDAGSVVSTFASSISGGGLGVGLVLFLILVLINFIVITKGSGRVSEVAARFTLDALPGKQMAIDADLNAGVIDEPTAKIRREELTDEADFYGAMDGASKFVRGDAIAGLVITSINLVAGIVIGVLVNEEGVSDALSRYSTLTIGDGLVSQIPALFVSVAAGLLVTKSGKESNIYVALNKQVFSSPKPLMAAAALVALMGAFTEFPKIPSFLVAGALLYTAYRMIMNEEQELERKKVEAETVPEESQAEPEKVESLLKVESMELEVGYGMIPLVDTKQGGDLLNRINNLRKTIAEDMGLVVPPIRIRDNMQLEPNQYVVKIRGNMIATGSVYPDKLLAIDAGSGAGKIEGIATIDPTFGMPATWISSDIKEKVSSLGYMVVEPSSVIATHLTEVVKDHAAEILTREEVRGLLNTLSETSKAVVEEVVPELLTYADIQKVLQNLLLEKVSIRDLETIMEVLGDYGRKTKDPDILTEYVRNGLNRSICREYIEEDMETNEKKMFVVTMSPKVEDLITNSLRKLEDGGTMLNIDPQVLNKITSSISSKLETLISAGHVAPIVLCSPSIRSHVSRFMKSSMASIVVISYNEIAPGVQVESVGMAEIE